MILVTGATGLNGNRLVRKLSAQGIKVRALVRNRQKAEQLASLQHAQIVEGDLGKAASLGPALDGVERAMLISSSAADMRDVQCNFTDAAKGAGVKHIVKLSGIMPDLDSPFRFARMHGEIEKHIEGAGVAFTHLRGGEFMHSYFRQVGPIVAKGILPLPMESARIASIDVDDLVDVAAHVLTTQGHAGKTYRLTGPEALTMAEVAQQLSAVAGKTITYLNVSPDDARRAQTAAGFPPYLIDALAELFAERRRGKESEVFNDVSALLQRPAKTFAAFAAQYAAVFSGAEPPPKG